ncbi:hypothetical protein [Ornithinimicrobium pratense]|uniref:Fis family transcriptional regulator n=1 Tax=Ornithinimicrobium pratense TaxID=2593973 RepID=A0A5J6V4T4_9MICO|nr:hypothetical protein [Ornithinimicrobium pratense]QFG68023.1 hypothetical protein FY030_04185 [Ornithinimicrobium pratense]
MRWHQLFEDLGAQLAALELQERAAEVAEHVRAERGQIELVHRLAADPAAPVRLRVRGVGWIDVDLTDVGRDWILAQGAGSGRTGRELLVPLPAVCAVEGLATRADPREQVASRRFGLRSALRAVSRDRARVRIHDVDGDHLTGTIDAVMADHLDLARHADDEPRRASAVRGRVSLAYATLALVRRL